MKDMPRPTERLATWIRLPVLAGALLAASSLAASADDAQPFAFGLWGDMPYAKANDQPKIAPLIADMNASDIAFSMYDGDIKDGSSKCTDDVYTAAIDMFNSFKAPAVYVPGDNEWTDCHRTNNGGYDNLERLDHIRKVMFTDTQSFGQTKMPMEHQGKPGEKFAENTRFVHGNIVFVGLDIPGSNNNKVNSDKICTNKSARTPEKCAADNAEYAERDAANIAWMHEAFELARRRSRRASCWCCRPTPGSTCRRRRTSTSGSRPTMTATPTSSPRSSRRRRRFRARSSSSTATRTSSRSTSRSSSRTI